MSRFVSVTMVLGALGFGMTAPQSVTPLKQQDLEEGVEEVRRAMSDVATTLSRIQRDAINNEEVFFEGQRRRLRGILALVRCVETVNDGMPPSRDKATVAICLRAVSGEISQAVSGVRSLESANDHGHRLLTSKAFAPLDATRAQPKLSVGESIVP